MVIAVAIPLVVIFHCPEKDKVENNQLTPKKVYVLMVAEPKKSAQPHEQGSLPTV